VRVNPKAKILKMNMIHSLSYLTFT
jgi:hypothetical protein